jgi:uncharacterized protein (DUF58 family)
MIPTVRTGLLAAAGLAVAVLPALVDHRLWPLWASANALLLIAVVADALLIPRRGSLEARFAAPRSLAVGEEGSLEVAVSAAGLSPGVLVSALAEIGGILEPQPEALLEPTPDGAAASTSVRLLPRRRGTATIPAVWLRLRGPLGLAESRVRKPVGSQIAIVPDVRPVRAAALIAVRPAAAGYGSKTMRFVGEGTDFASLRDYAPGHDHRALSWRASARHRKLLVREFRAERDQPVVLAFDTGHLMSEPLDGIPRLDHAITAGLLLASSCLRNGDRVGLFSFGAAPSGFRPPSAGTRSFAALREWTSALDYGTDESNYTLALSHLSERLRRRSLVVLMTDFVDVVAARLMIENVARLVRRHLVLFATLSDPAPRRLLEAEPRSIGDVHRAVVAGQLVREREAVLSRLRRLGVHCLDCEPGELRAGIVERYLWIKRREIL